MAKLPKELKIDIFDIAKKQDKSDELWEMITDYLTETYGYCVNGYSIKSSNIELCDIDFDTTEEV